MYEQDDGTRHVEPMSSEGEPYEDLIQIHSSNPITRWQQAPGKAKIIVVASAASILCMLALVIIALVNASTGCLEGVGAAVAIIVFVVLLSMCLFVVLWLGVAMGWTR